MNRSPFSQEIEIKSEEQSKLDTEFDEVRNHNRRRYRKARKIDFAEEVCISAERLGSLCQTIGKIVPGRYSGQVEEDLWQTIRREPGDVAEEQGKSQSRQQRLDYEPQWTKDRLFVERNEVPAHEQHYEIAIPPKVCQVQIEPAGLGTNNQSPLRF